MANPSFIDAIDEFRRRSALVGRPAEKVAMDKSLRENAIRRLTTTRDRVAPVTPAISEVVQGGGYIMKPQLDTAPGTEGVVPGISGVESGVIGQSTADAVEAAIAGMLGFEKGEEGYQPTPTMPLSVLSFTNPAILGKAIPLAKPLIKGALSEGRGGLEPGDIPGLEYGGQPNPHGEANLAANPDTAAPAPPPAPAPTASFGDTVLCTELYRQGLLPLDLYLADSRYGAKLDQETLAGYHAWAEPLAKAMSQSKALTSIVSPFVKAWAYEMAYREGVLSKGNWLGKVLSFIGEPVCGFIGRSLNNGYEPDFH